ncbi:MULTISPECIES: DUF6074 family protein [unclassified Rhizobium]|uniref:DUF6074 family protein n=1 Tax=unclassified Rhizobium TaxID=2613769 RepID=UPI003D2DC6D6
MTLAHFPADRRTADIRRCAQALLTLHGEEANQYWRSEMRAIAAELAQQGAEPQEISRQAALFMNAVQMELQALFAADDDLAVDARA